MFGTDSALHTQNNDRSWSVLGQWGLSTASGQWTRSLKAEERVFRLYHAAGVTLKVTKGCYPQLDIAEVVAPSAALS